MVRTLVLLISVGLLAAPADVQARVKNRRSPVAAQEKSSGKKSRSSEQIARSSSEADRAFLEAKKAFAALKKDPRRRKFRDQWLAVAEKFEAVAEKHPSSPRAADALYNAAQLYSELSRVSLARRDLRQAIAAFGRLCEKYPRSNLADDAHVALGRIYRDRKGDMSSAEAEFKAAAACRGDMAASARAALAELATLPRPKAKERPAEEPPKLARAEPKDERPEPARPSEAAKITLATRDSEDEEDEAEEVAIALPSSGALDPARVKALKAAARSEVPLSVQMGLKVKRVIIDAGHGGYDTGAIGKAGVREKDVTLAVALKLKDRLEADGYEALLTRDDDSFVALEDRARFANKHKGDLFVSIHCNAHKSRKMRGVETYTLNVTADRYAIRLAARENASSERSLSDLQLVLADLATKANTHDSTRLARAVQSELVEAQSDGAAKARNLGVKQALFYVLMGVRMPSVLVETAFLSNPEDEKRLDDPLRQKALADAIAEGVARFVAERDALATALID